MRLPSLSSKVKDFIHRAPRAMADVRAFDSWRSTMDKIQQFPGEVHLKKTARLITPHKEPALLVSFDLNTASSPCQANSRDRTTSKRGDYPAVAADRAGISSFRGSTPSLPALLLNWVVHPNGCQGAIR
jgi:hypothetical protein